MLCKRVQALTTWMLVLLLALSFGLRVYRLGDRSVWWDEGWTAWAARQSWAAMTHLMATDVHPPLYTWLLHIWQGVSGDTEFGLRFLSALIGLLTVAATYLLGRLVGGRATGLLAALLIAISRFDIDWSQQMRMYALAALLAALALWAAIRVWDRGRPPDWVLYILFMTAGLYTLYLFVSVLIVVNMAWLLWTWPHAPDRWREFRRWSAAQTAVLLLFAPWLAYAWGRIPTWSSASPIVLSDFLKIYWTVLNVGIPLNVEAYTWLTLPVFGIFLLGVAILIWGERGQWRQERNIVLLLAGLSFPALLVYLVSLPRDSFFYAPQIAPRYLLTFVTAYGVLLAWGIIRLAARYRRLPAVLLAAVVITVTLSGLRSYYPGRVLMDDYISLAATIVAHKQPGDAVLLFTDTDWPLFAYHYPEPWRGIPHAWQMTPQTTADYLAPIWADNEGIWLVITPHAAVSDPQGRVSGWLAARATAVLTTSYQDKALHFYARTPARAATMYDLAHDVRPQYRVTAALTPHVGLVGYEQAARDYKSGDMIHLFLFWRGQDERAQAEVGLIDADGRAWQWERIDPPTGNEAPTHGLARQQINLTIPPDAPAGDYNFYLFNNQGETVRFGRVFLRQKQAVLLTTADGAIDNRLDAHFDTGIRLLGYDIETDPIRPGETLSLTLYWQAQTVVSQRYKVFTHLLGQVYNAENDNFLWGQQDNEPLYNTRPTSTWRTGEVIVDNYAIPIHAQAPDGSYTVEIGLYDPVTGVRLPIIDAAGAAVADHLVLTSLTIGEEP